MNSTLRPTPNARHPSFSVTVTDPRRRAAFLQVVGTDTVAVTTDRPFLGNLPGHTTAVEFYQLDMETLDDTARERLVAYISDRFDMTYLDVFKLLGRTGFPILAADCELHVHNPVRWWG